MPSTYTNSNRFTLQATGENNNTWGSILNSGVFSLVDDSLDGVISVSCTTGVDITLSTSNGAADDARHRILTLTGTPTNNINLIIPGLEKWYLVDASGLTGAYTVTIKTSSGTGIGFTTGLKGIIYCNGTNTTNIGYLTASSSVVESQQIPPGTLLDFAGSVTPSGYLLCDGSNVSRTTYAALFASIGTTWGAGDGSTTFTLPDLRGRTTVGRDDMGGSAAGRVTNAVSGITGTSLGAVGGNQNSQLHSHTASVTDPGHPHAGGQATFQNAAAAGGSGQVWYGAASNTSSSTTGISVSIANSGTGTSQNMQPSAIANKIIKT